MISTPEYAFGVPGVLKNALDWTVASGDFAGKPTAAISSSPSELGGDKAYASLQLTLRAMQARLPTAWSAASSSFVRKKLDATAPSSTPRPRGAPRDARPVAALAPMRTFVRATGCGPS